MYIFASLVAHRCLISISSLRRFGFDAHEQSTRSLTHWATHSLTQLPIRLHGGIILETRQLDERDGRSGMVTTHSSAFGSLLKGYRIAAGLTQEELAERARLSARAVSDLERGARRAPYRDTVQQLAEALALNDDERAALEAAARGRAESAESSPGEQDVSLSPTNLLDEPTPFIGRAREIEQIAG